MKSLPKIQEILDEELSVSLNKSDREKLKRLIMLFRKAYEKIFRMAFTSEPMRNPDSDEVMAMAVECLEVGIAANPVTKQKEVPAANTLLVQALGYPVEREK